MRVAIASDHAGFEQKQQLAIYISETLGHEVLDLGPYSDARCDYPDFGEKLGRAVAEGVVERGIGVCGTGIGISMAAGKIAGVRAASITSPQFAEFFRHHNDGNVLGLSGRFVSFEQNCDIVKIFLGADFDGGRHAERVTKLMALDETGRPQMSTRA